MSAAPRYNHQVVCAALGLALGRWCEVFRRGDAVPATGPDFSERDAVIPDFVLPLTDLFADLVP